MSIKISCIIPTCDRPQYLSKAIASVLDQTLLPLEIIIVNNGQTKTVLPDVIKNQVIIYDIIPYAGVAQARNFGAALATGDYLAFLDDDDLWPDTYLEKSSEALFAGAVCVVNRLDVLRAGLVVRYKNAQGKLTPEKLVISNPGVTGSNILLKKELFLAVGGFDVRLPPSEDKALILELVSRGVEIEVLPDNAAILREHEGVRLSSPERLGEGTYFFIKKYGQLMNWRARLLNWNKVYKNRYLKGELVATWLYYLTGLINKGTTFFYEHRN